MTHPNTNPLAVIEQLVGALEAMERATQTNKVYVQAEASQKCRAALTAARAHLDQPTQPAPSTAGEREAFEAHIAKDCGDLSTFGSGKNMHYRNSSVNHEWEGWKARAALLQSTALPAKQVMQISDSYGPLDANGLERVAKENPDQYFLKGSGVLKLIAAIRELEQKATPAALPVGELTDDAIAELIVKHKLMDQAWPTQKMLTEFALAAARSQPVREPTKNDHSKALVQDFVANGYETSTTLVDHLGKTYVVEIMGSGKYNAKAARNIEGILAAARAQP